MSAERPGPARLIVDRAGGRVGDRHAVGRGLPALRAALDERDLPYDVVDVTGWAGAAAAARIAVDEGLRLLIAVGGDAVVHGIVNALVEVEVEEAGVEAGNGGAGGHLDLGAHLDVLLDGSGGSPVGAGATTDLAADLAADLARRARVRAPDALLGVADLGAGGDFARTFGLDRGPDRVVAHLTGPGARPVDVGVLACRDPDGALVTRAFANVAHVGYDADLARRVARSRLATLPGIAGRLGKLFAAYGAVAAGPRPRTAVALAHATQEFPLVDLVVANGQFRGDGDRIAPRALPDDGVFDAVVFSGDRSQVLTATQRIHRGEHFPGPAVSEYRTPRVALAPRPPLHVEADTVHLGITPAVFALLPGALRLKV